MPWQRQVAAVSTELDPSRPGAFRYDTAVSVPRQVKLSLRCAIMADRIMSYNRQQRSQVTAQIERIKEVEPTNRCSKGR